MHRCPKCKLLPREYKLVEQDPLDGHPGDGALPADVFWDLIFSPLHVDLRSCDGFLRLACLNQPEIMSSTCVAALRHIFDRKMQEIQEAYLNRGQGYKKLYVKFVTPDGGNTINGCNNSSRALPHY